MLLPITWIINNSELRVNTTLHIIFVCLRAMAKGILFFLAYFFLFKNKLFQSLFL